MREVYIGIDNGVTRSSIGYMNTITGEYFYKEMPIKNGRDYTQREKNITRIVYSDLCDIFKRWLTVDKNQTFILLERPMINPERFEASIVAARAYEIVITAIEQFNIEFDTIDSRLWQKKLLPIGTKGEADLKQASFDLGLKLFPSCISTILKVQDADGLMIALYAKTMEL